ncbi:hypothetical protein GCM10009528_09460 [Kineococcus aurantiacus]
MATSTAGCSMALGRGSSHTTTATIARITSIEMTIDCTFPSERRWRGTPRASSPGAVAAAGAGEGSEGLPVVLTPPW